MTLKPTQDGAAAPDRAMFGPPDGIAPPPDAAMFGGDVDDPYTPPPDPEESQFQPVEIETPQSEGNENAPGTGQPGDRGYTPTEAESAGNGEPGPLTPPLAFGLHTTQAQEQTVKDDRGVVTTFVSDLPQK